MFTKLYLVFYMIRCLLCFTKYRLLNVDIYYDVADSQMITNSKVLCAKECMEVKVCCASFAFHENRKTCYFYNFKLQADYVNVTDPGLMTYVDVEEGFQKQYNITIQTGDETVAGTNSKIKMQLFGTKDKTKEHVLDIDGYDDFERYAKDTYQFYDVDVNYITVINFKTDNRGYEPGWNLDTVRITTCLSDETTRMVFKTRDDADVTIPSREMFYYNCTCKLGYTSPLQMNITVQQHETVNTTKTQRI